MENNTPESYKSKTGTPTRLVTISLFFYLVCNVPRVFQQWEKKHVFSIGRIWFRRRTCRANRKWWKRHSSGSQVSKLITSPCWLESPYHVASRLCKISVMNSLPQLQTVNENQLLMNWLICSAPLDHQRRGSVRSKNYLSRHCTCAICHFLFVHFFSYK